MGFGEFLPDGEALGIAVDRRPKGRHYKGKN